MAQCNLNPFVQTTSTMEGIMALTETYSSFLEEMGEPEMEEGMVFANSILTKEGKMIEWGVVRTKKGTLKVVPLFGEYQAAQMKGPTNTGYVPEKEMEMETKEFSVEEKQTLWEKAVGLAQIKSHFFGRKKGTGEVDLLFEAGVFLPDETRMVQEILKENEERDHVLFSEEEHEALRTLLKQELQARLNRRIKNRTSALAKDDPRKGPKVARIIREEKDSLMDRCQYIKEETEKLLEEPTYQEFIIGSNRGVVTPGMDCPEVLSLIEPVEQRLDKELQTQMESEQRLQYDSPHKDRGECYGMVVAKDVGSITRHWSEEDWRETMEKNSQEKVKSIVQWIDPAFNVMNQRKVYREVILVAFELAGLQVKEIPFSWAERWDLVKNEYFPAVDGMDLTPTQKAMKRKEMFDLTTLLIETDKTMSQWKKAVWNKLLPRLAQLRKSPAKCEKCGEKVQHWDDQCEACGTKRIPNRTPDTLTFADWVAVRRAADDILNCDKPEYTGSMWDPDLEQGIFKGDVLSNYRNISYNEFVQRSGERNTDEDWGVFCGTEDEIPEMILPEVMLYSSPDYERENEELIQNMLFQVNAAGHPAEYKARLAELDEQLSY